MAADVTIGSVEWKIAPAGDRGLLIDLGADVTAAKLHAAADRLRKVDEVLACIVGQQSLYVVGDREPSPDLVRLAKAAPEWSQPGRTHSILVSFAPGAGADLEEFLVRHSMTRDDFLARVADLRLTARYLGFRAGFAYLDGWPEEWRMARRPTSRRVVPRGSFAVANAVAGFYPVDSPGGWNILGRTNELLWDPTREPPSLIAAGDEVRIIPTLDLIDPPPQPEEPRLTLTDIEVTANARFTTAVGPSHWRRIRSGLPPGGPFDAELAAAANQAVGNSPSAPLLECAMAGPTIRVRRDLYVAWCGAVSDLPQNEARAMAAGEEIKVGRIRGGLRGYLAFGPQAGSSPSIARDDYRRIRMVPGPHDDLSIESLRCEVTPQLDRVGIRLRPLEPVPIVPPSDLPSCGMQFGTVQLHPDGTLVAMGPDHPVTGGYLQAMTVRWAERWKLGQLMPGEQVEFVRS